MSGSELLVIAFGLFIGYWIVSKFSAGKKSDNAPGRQQSGSEFDELHKNGSTGKEEASSQQQEREPADDEPAAWHEILNVPPNADIQEVRRAYKSLMSQYHPDKVASLGPELRELCERKTKEINIAYDRAMAERGAV